MKHIKILGRTENLDIQIVNGQFKHAERRTYIEKACETVDRHIESPKAVLFDPDTGIEPSKSKPTEQHVMAEEIEQVWRHLKCGDWLVVYQHAFRNENWRTMQRKNSPVLVEAPL